MTAFCDNPVLRNYWYAVATDRELEQGPIGRTLLGQNIVIYRDPAGGVVAAPDRCPHREAPLSAGSVNDGVLTCCYHGWSFGVGGKCGSIPSASRDFPIPGNADLPCVNARLCYGLVWVCLGEDARELPRISQDSNPEFRRINSPIEQWRVSATRVTDNTLDVAHFPWVHTGTFGSSQRREVPKFNLKTLDDSYHGYEYEVIAENPPSAGLSSGQAGSTVSRKMSTGFHLPFAVRSTIAYDTGLQHILLLLPTPIDDVTSYFTFVVWRNDDFSVSAEDIIAFDRMIGAEDKVMLERIPGTMPLTPRGLATTQSDKASTAWRHQFARVLGLDAS